VKILPSFLLLAALATSVASADDAKPKSIVGRATRVCAACHDASAARTEAAIPSLAAQTPMYIVNQLKDFRGQKRAESDTQAYMWGISALLDDATINDLGEYFSKLPPEPGRPGNARLIEQGREIFEKGVPGTTVRACSTCHGKHAEGASVFPRLAGQNAEYLYREMRVFSTTLRPHGVLMKNEVATLSEEQMRAVAEYLQSL
jgi:cytochrome c553